jgi:hypothetical protein
MVKIRKTFFAAWTIVLAFTAISIVQPSAYALEYPMVSQMLLIDPAASDLTSALTVTADQDPAAPVIAESPILNPQSELPSSSLMALSLENKAMEFARTATGAKAFARDLVLNTYGWNKSQASCLNQLWDRESHWNYKAHNYRSGAHGIPQALPANKMDVIATDWRTNPLTQIRWGLKYINSRYKTPCAALRTFHRIGHY